MRPSQCGRTAASKGDERGGSSQSGASGGGCRAAGGHRGPSAPCAGGAFGRPRRSTNLRHADNFLSTYDLWAHRRCRELFTDILGSFVYASEEADPQVIGDDSEPDLCVLVDPLDTSELAVRGLHGYTHVLIYSRRLARPIVAVVGDIFHHIQLYVAARHEDGHDAAAVLTADGAAYPIGRMNTVGLSEALVTNYLMRPGERFRPLARQERLLQALSESGADGRSRGRIGVDFGSVGLCHVAAGWQLPGVPTERMVTRPAL